MCSLAVLFCRARGHVKGPRTRRAGSWNTTGLLRRRLCLFVGAILVTLAPIASASPPDAMWIPGVYDGADYDDVVDLLCAGDSVSQEINARRAAPADQVTAKLLHRLREEFVPFVVCSQSRPRSPPIG